MTGITTALVIFLRRPAPGIGKQRLARAIGMQAAHAVAEALLACALEDAAAWPHEVVLAPAEPLDADWAAGLLAPRARVVPQPAGNLGERLQQVDAQLRSRGLEQLLFIGSDAPSLSCAQLEQARGALSSCDVVLAPAADGGVTLMGARRPWPPLAQLPWSTAQLAAALEGACRAVGYSVARLPPSYDVDEAPDLILAGRELAGDPRPARRRLAAVISGLGDAR